MRVREILYQGQPPIDAYGGGGFRISGVFHAGSLAILPSGVSAWSGRFDEAGLEAFLAEAADIDVLLLGMGAEIALPPAAAREMLEGAGIGVEPMSTGSACRTFNVLLAEDRRIGAALIAV